MEQAAIVSRAKSHCSTLVEKDKIRSMKTISRKGSIDDSENLNFITSQIVLRSVQKDSLFQTIGRKIDEEFQLYINKNRTDLILLKKTKLKSLHN